MKKPLIKPVDPERVKDVAEAVYRDRLGECDAAAMVAKDKDQGQKLRARAQAYAPLVAPFARALGVELPRVR